MANFSKKKLLQETEKYYFPQIPPEKAVGDILTIKERRNEIKKFSDWYVARDDPECTEVAAKRQLRQAEIELEEKKNEMKNRRQELDKDWKTLANQENNLRQNFINFNKFVRENNNKRIRAESKLEMTIKYRDNLQEQLTSVKDKRDDLKIVKKRMEEQIGKHVIYETFISNFIKEYTNYRVDNDVITRYESLAEAKEELANRQLESIKILENIKTEMFKFTQSATLQIASLVNQRAYLEARYQITKLKTQNWEILIAKIINSCNEQFSKLSQIRASCWNVYLSMCSRKNIEPEYKKDDFENQLVFIKNTISELKIIIPQCRKKMAHMENFAKP